MRNNDTTKQQTKLTMVSVSAMSVHKTVFVNLPVDEHGKVCYDYPLLNRILHSAGLAGMQLSRGVTISVG